MASATGVTGIPRAHLPRAGTHLHRTAAACRYVVTTSRFPGPPGTTVAPPLVVSANFAEQLRRTLAWGESAVNDLIRSYDEELADHHREVTRIASAIARRMGIHPRLVTGIALASSIHDIGAIGAQPQPVSGPTGRLASPEVHSTVGASMIDDIRFPWPLSAMILQHHERMDGSGFPFGLSREAILLSSRVIAVADTVATMSEAGCTLDATRMQLVSGRGTSYDSDVVDACLGLFPPSPTDGVASWSMHR